MPKIFLPSLHNRPGQTEPAELPCGMNSLAYDFAQRWLDELGNRASKMRCHVDLVKAAQRHAEWLSQNYVVGSGISMHVGQNGSTPNRRARAAGYDLSDRYGNGNTIESVARASTRNNTPQAVLTMLLNSEPHREHLMGEGWYKDSTRYGIGVEGRYYVALVAPPED